MSDISAYGLHRFGAARPPIVEVYASESGWMPHHGRTQLTTVAAESLLSAGVSMVRVKWRLRTHEVILRRYLR